MLLRSPSVYGNSNVWNEIQIPLYAKFCQSGYAVSRLFEISLAIRLESHYNVIRSSKGAGCMKLKSFFQRPTKSSTTEYSNPPRKEFSLIRGTPSDALYAQIKGADRFSEFWERHKKRIVHQPLSEYLCELLDEKGLKRSDVVVRTGLDKAYVYQIFAGKKKNPSRDKLITIAIGMKFSEEETRRMLQLSGHRELWPKDERDALLLFAVQRGMSLEEVHTELERYGLDPLAAPVK